MNKITIANFSKEHYIKVKKITYPCHHYNGAEEVAEYIVNEIKINTKSNSAETMRYFNDYEKRISEWKQIPLPQRLLIPMPKIMTIEALAIWTERVFAGRPWDHKTHIPNLFRHVAVHRKEYSKKSNKIVEFRSYYHKYNKHDYFYDVWSNIHYGYVGLSVGFDEKVLLRGAASAQFIDSRGSNLEDAIDDITAIKIGFRLYTKFGTYAENLTYLDILEELESESDEVFPESRKKHICLEK